MSDHPSATSQPPPASSDPALGAVLGDHAALWQTLQETTGEYVAVVDREGIIRECNRFDEGFTREQVIGHSLVRFTDTESTRAVLEALRRVFEDGQLCTIETTVRRHDGGINNFSLRLGPIRHDGRIVAALVCCESIRSLKTSERALQHERNVLHRLLDIQESERQLVAYDIHDGLAQQIAGALMHLEAHEHALGIHPPPTELAQALRLLRKAADEARRLIGGLRPPALDELGIVDAVESLVAEARAELSRVEFRHALPPPRLPAQVETTIFRIVQEALMNVRKHAAARSADVVLERVPGGVRVAVRDDGRGFDPGLVPEDRFGLEGIRQRARLLGSEPRVTTAPEAGTTVEVVLPLADG
jgi:PAS domain S-box-containing protein